jgi:hypothetical protein
MNQKEFIFSEFIFDLAEHRKPDINSTALRALDFIAQNGPISAYDYQKKAGIKYYKMARSPIQELIKNRLIETHDRVQEKNRLKILYRITIYGWVSLIFDSANFGDFLKQKSPFYETPFFKILISPYIEEKTLQSLEKEEIRRIVRYLQDVCLNLAEDSELHFNVEAAVDFGDREDEMDLEDLSTTFRSTLNAFLVGILTSYDADHIATLKKVTKRDENDHALDYARRIVKNFEALRVDRKLVSRLKVISLEITDKVKSFTALRL